VLSNGVWWNVDAYGRLLEEMPSKPQGLIEIQGITPEEPVAGKKIKVSESAATRLVYMLEVLKGFEDEKIQDGVSVLDVSNIGNITFTYNGRFKVNLGNTDDIQYKLQQMQGMIKELGTVESGTLDLSNPGRRSFIPG